MKNDIIISGNLNGSKRVFAKIDLIDSLIFVTSENDIGDK